MFTQTRNKRAVSIMIGYVLLVTFAVVISVFVYQWLKTYVPSEGIECPDDVSLYISEKSLDLTNNVLSLTLVNSGKFNIDGIFIYYSESETQEIATKKIAKNITSGAEPWGEGLLFKNKLLPNGFKPLTFNITGIENIYSVEITPIRQQEAKNKIQPVSCTDSKIKEII